MAQSQRRWDVVYEQVDLHTHTTVQKFAAQNVNWKTALMVKRNHKRIVSMKICPTKLAPDAGKPAPSWHVSN